MSDVDSLRGYARTITRDGSTKDHKYDFDIYIAYVVEDIRFVKENLIYRLDKAYDGCYKCCFEHRNFAGGSAIVDCIMEAMCKSHVTILVLSRNALEKGLVRDTTIDFISQHMLSSVEFRNRLKPLKIDHCRIPACLRHLRILDATKLSREEFDRHLNKLVNTASCLVPDDERIRSSRSRDSRGCGCETGTMGHPHSCRDCDHTRLNSGSQSFNDIPVPHNRDVSSPFINPPTSHNATLPYAGMTSHVHCMMPSPHSMTSPCMMPSPYSMTSHCMRPLMSSMTSAQYDVCAPTCGVASPPPPALSPVDYDPGCISPFPRRTPQPRRWVPETVRESEWQAASDAYGLGHMSAHLRQDSFTQAQQPLVQFQERLANINKPQTALFLRKISTQHGDNQEAIQPVSSCRVSVYGEQGHSTAFETSSEYGSNVYEEVRWSKECFDNNPTEYVQRFCDTNPESAVFSRIEQVLLGDILTEDTDCHVSLMYLANLTKCRSTVVKARAFKLMDRHLMGDDLSCFQSAERLSEAERYLRHTIKSWPFHDESLEFQTFRIKIYSKMLFYLAMHVEKRHVTLFDKRLLGIGEIDTQATHMLKNINNLTMDMQYALLQVTEAYNYLRQLFHGLKFHITGSKLTDLLAQLQHVRNYENYVPWNFMTTKLNTSTMWPHVEIIMGYMCNMVFSVPKCITVLLAHVSLMLESRRDVEICQYGVLLSTSQLLAYIANNHPEKETRLLAVFGKENPRKPWSGLKHIWQSDICCKRQESGFQESFHRIVYPLLFSAIDDEIKQAIFVSFFTDDYTTHQNISANTTGSNIEIELRKAIKQFMTEQYENVGYKLKFKSVLLHKNGQLYIMKGRFNDTKVVIKLVQPTDNQDISHTNTYSSLETQNAQKRRHLWNEISILSKLEHKSILRLLAKTDQRYIPMHGIFEYMEGGSLDRYLKNCRHSHPILSQANLCHLALQVVEGVKYLGEMGIVHRDLCAANVLYSIDHTLCTLVCKLTSFSLACSEKDAACLEDIATSGSDVLLRHSAPESISKRKWSIYSDRWMLASVIYEIFTLGCPPFPECSDAAEVHSWILDHRHVIHQTACLRNSVFKIILSLMQIIPNMRSSPTSIIQDLQDVMSTKEYNDDDLHEGLPTIPDHPLQRAENSSGIYNLLGETDHGRSTQSAGHDTQIPTLVTPDKIDPEWADQPMIQPRVDVFFSPLQSVHANVEKLNHSLSDRMAECLLGMESRNVVKIYAINRKSRTELVSESPSAGDIMSYVLANHGKITVEHIIDVMIQVLDAVSYLHVRHLIHSDLKAQYVYVNRIKDNGYAEVKLGRLGRCQMMVRRPVDKEGIVLHPREVPRDSLRWSAPETFFIPPFCKRASDVYSWSKVFWQLLHGLELGEHIDQRCVVPHADWPLEHEVFRLNHMMHKHPVQPAHCPDWLYLLLKMCWRDCIKRPTLEQIRNTLTARHPFQTQLLTSFQDHTEKLFKGIDIQVCQPEHALYIESDHMPLLQDGCSTDVNLAEPPEYYLSGARFKSIVSAAEAEHRTPCTLYLRPKDDMPPSLNKTQNRLSAETESVVSSLNLGAEAATLNQEKIYKPSSYSREDIVVHHADDPKHDYCWLNAPASDGSGYQVLNTDHSPIGDNNTLGCEPKEGSTSGSYMIPRPSSTNQNPNTYSMCSTAVLATKSSFPVMTDTGVQCQLDVESVCNAEVHHVTNSLSNGFPNVTNTLTKPTSKTFQGLLIRARSEPNIHYQSHSYPDLLPSQSNSSVNELLKDSSDDSEADGKVSEKSYTSDCISEASSDSCLYDDIIEGDDYAIVHMDPGEGEVSNEPIIFQEARQVFGHSS